ncbi:hypothetical protein TNCV_5081301 [Trichonephila clavipes]|nr:hypothetical protein TNCV_5081301 [Trichonephila clavipes]
MTTGSSLTQNYSRSQNSGLRVPRHTDARRFFRRFCSELVVRIASMGKLPDLAAFDRKEIVDACAIQFPKSTDS